MTQEILDICKSKLLTAPTDKSLGALMPYMELTRPLQSQGKFSTDFEEFLVKPAVNHVWFSPSIYIMITLHSVLCFFPVYIYI